MDQPTSGDPEVLAPQPPDDAPQGEQLVLGNPQTEGRTEAFLDGRLQVVSARGVRGAERALIAAFDQKVSGKVLSVRSREGLAGLAAARLFPETEVHLFDLDSYARHRALQSARQNGLESIESHLSADLPQGDYDWVCLPVAHSEDAMLSGELLRQAFGALRPRGKLLAATDNRRDRWLHDRVRDVFGDVTIYRRDRKGTVYVARRPPGKTLRTRRFGRQFTGRVFDKIVELESRPGVFSHGRVDDGAMSLADVAELGPSSRVLEMGCGSGALGTAAALAAPSGCSVLVDSNVRAVKAAQANLVRNGAPPNSLVCLSHDFECFANNTFDVVLANPPYFGDYRIIELFTREARRLLTPSGVYYCVTKLEEKSREICEQHFTRCTTTARRDYTVFTCR